VSNAALAGHTPLVLPEGAHATEPPEARGLPRDGVRLLVAQRSGMRHARFRSLPELLRPGDLVVVNTSATLPAAVDGTERSGRVVVHFSSPLRGHTWIVERRRRDGAGPVRAGTAGEVVHLPGGARVRLLTAHPDRAARSSRLWRARFEGEVPVEDYLARFGRPITYVYMRKRWPLAAYQTIFARHPGSAEMPSAARPFSHPLVTDLVAAGVAIAPLLLHTGVSSLEAGEPPQEERFAVPLATARLVNETRRAGGLVIAVGTTVARALETAARPDGTVAAARGRTDLVLGPDRRARVIDGLITGWHPPQASHLSLLEAVTGRELVQQAYDEAVAAGYLWHEFGDSCLLLRRRRGRRRLHALPRAA
jgi:S-adenosylmethionine:tRNA ribosyltransferase-isomerase